LADLLFTPSDDADRNLLREGVSEEKIKRVGNIMIDTLKINLEKARALEAHKRYRLEAKKYVFVTLHRPSNVDDKESLGCIMQNLVAYLKDCRSFSLCTANGKEFDSIRHCN